MLVENLGYHSLSAIFGQIVNWLQQETTTNYIRSNKDVPPPPPSPLNNPPTAKVPRLIDAATNNTGTMSLITTTMNQMEDMQTRIKSYEHQDHENNQWCGGNGGNGGNTWYGDNGGYDNNGQNCPSLILV